jgi:hypothetical protein
VLAFTRISGQEEVFVIVNLRNKNVTYDIPALFENTVWKGAFTGSEVTLPVTMDLGAYEYLILKK